MNTEELKTQLLRETQAKNSLVELAKTALTNSVETCRKDLSESAQNFRSDLRDEMKKARESWEKTTKAERQAWSEERKTWESTKRRFLIWGLIGLFFVVVMTSALSVAVMWTTVSKGTEMVFAGLQQGEASKLADLRAQTEMATRTLNRVQEQTRAGEETLRKTQAEAQGEQKTLVDLRQSIEEQNQILADAKARSSRLTNFAGKNGEIYVEVMPEAKPFDFNGRTIIQAKPSE